MARLFTSGWDRRKEEKQSAGFRNEATRAIDDKRNFEPRSSDEEDALAALFSLCKLLFHTNRQDSELNRFFTHRSPIHGESSVAPGPKTTICQPRIRDPNHNATAVT
ncbi:hypothetical protein TNCV_282921 [Trichonephila clavipes]|nr:hypothetical protein TNCV_282921 [Trichonephila clavipes]